MDNSLDTVIYVYFAYSDVSCILAVPTVPRISGPRRISTRRTTGRAHCGIGELWQNGVWKQVCLAGRGCPLLKQSTGILSQIKVQEIYCRVYWGESL